MTRARRAFVSIGRALSVALAATAIARAAAAPSDATTLDVYANGHRLELLTAAEDAQGFALYHRHSDDGGRTWSAPVEIGPSRGRLVNPTRNMDPQIIARGDDLLAVWTAPGRSALSGGPVATALSSDAGRTWRPGPSPNDDGGSGEHAFIDGIADEGGAFHLVWLDARDGRQGLHFASSPDRGRRWTANRTLDTETCECCWNAMAAGWDRSLLVLYRDIPRDMALARSTDGGASWQRTGWVGAFGWAIQGCPDTGGAIVRGGAKGTVHALVFTGEESRRGLYVLTSPDDGRTWGTPVKVGADRAWHGDLAYAGGTLVAAWDVNDRDRQIGWAYSIDNGRTWVDGGRASQPGVVPSHPKLAVAGGVALLWTERDREGRMSWKSVPLQVPRK